MLFWGLGSLMEASGPVDIGVQDDPRARRCKAGPNILTVV